MNLIQSQWNLIEKAVRTKDGRDAVAIVAVLVVGGKVVSARIVDVRILSSFVSKKETLKLCSGYIKNSAPVSNKQKVLKTVSPYFDTQTILVTQSPRAPSIII